MEDKLYQAADLGNELEARRILRENPKLKVNRKYRIILVWRTALNRACERGRDKVVSLLLAHPDIDVNPEEFWGGNSFHGCFVTGGRLPALNSCSGFRVKTMSLLGDGYTPLHRAAEKGHLEVIKWWIASGREMDLGQPQNWRDGCPWGWHKRDQNIPEMIFSSWRDSRRIQSGLGVKSKRNWGVFLLLLFFLIY